MFTKGREYYSKSHYIMRFLWQITYILFFRYSPRLIYPWRIFLLRIFGAKIGKNVKIFPSVLITYPWNLEVQESTVIAWGVKIYNLGFIKIGKNTIISQYAHLCAGDHDYKDPRFKLLMPPITIGDGVWIASEAFIGPRVIIENKAVIGARAVVVRNVPESAVFAGNPAKMIKMRD